MTPIVFYATAFTKIILYIYKKYMWRIWSKISDM